jgi:SH3-like domain-containing protein
VRAAPRFAAIALATGAVALAGCGARDPEGKDCTTPASKTPSGFCIPRYVSLKRGEVYARKGPGKDYETLFVYHARGLPVQIVQETTDWRRICDPDGALVWVHRSMVDGRRTVMAAGAAPTPILAFAKPGAPAAALLNPRALASLDQCRGAWCKVSVDGKSGWVARAAVWGTADPPQCKVTVGPATAAP